MNHGYLHNHPEKNDDIAHGAIKQHHHSGTMLENWDISSQITHKQRKGTKNWDISSQITHKQRKGTIPTSTLE